MVMVPPSACQTTSALKMPMVPRVTMKGSMRPNVTTRPLARPQAALTATATAMPSARVSTPPEPAPFSVRIITPATRAAMEPTERSSPPPAITKVAPIAMMAMKAERVTTLRRFAGSRKLGLTRAPSARSAASAMKGESARMSTVGQRRPAAGAATASVMGEALLSGPALMPGPPSRRSPPPRARGRRWRGRRSRPPSSARPRPRRRSVRSA